MFNPVGWFEIPMVDLASAKKFYEDLFGIELVHRNFMGYEMLWFPSDDGAKGISGALMKGMGYKPTLEGPIVYFTCPQLDETLATVERLGGEIFVPKKAIGEFGFIAIVGDSEGNRIGLHQVA